MANAASVVPGGGLLLRGRSAYFKALGSYSILRTCNTWLAEALVKGGLPLAPDAAARADDLMAQLRDLRWKGCTATREVPETEEE